MDARIMKLDLPMPDTFEAVTAVTTNIDAVFTELLIAHHSSNRTSLHRARVVKSITVKREGTEQRYLSPQELSKYLGIAIQTVYEWTSQKKVPYIKMGRLVKFDQREIDTWMQTQKVEPYNN